MSGDPILILPGANDPGEHLSRGLGAVRFDSADSAAAALAETEIVMSFGALLGDDFFAHAPRLRWLQVLGSGTDRIFDRPGFRDDILVTNAQGVAAIPVAETAITYMLALSRDVPGLLANQRAARWSRITPRLLHGLRLLIVGSGAAAVALAERAAAFGMSTHAVSATPRALPHVARTVGREQLEAEARDADMLVVLTGLSEATRRMVSRAVIEALPAGASVVDLSRGGIVDTGALVDRLKRGELRAALDVFESEPLPPDSVLWQQEGLIISPHVAGLHDRYPQMLLPLLQANLAAWRADRREAMVGVVTPPTGAPSR